MKLIIILSLILSNTVFSKCNPEGYSFKDYSESYTKIDFDSLCKIKIGDLINYCNGEACGYLSYPKAIRSVVLHEKPDLKSKIVGERNRCELIQGFELKSVFEDFGEAIALADIPGWNLKKGDVVKYYFQQEGDYIGCVKDRPVIFYATSQRINDSTCFEDKKPSKLEEWVYHTASNGKHGYSKVESDSFYVGYSGSDERCPGDKK